MGIADKNVKDLMSQNLIFSTPEASLQEIAVMMTEADCGEIPLIKDPEKMDVVGVITDRDIVCRTLGIGKNPMELVAQDCMTSPAVTATEDMPAKECIKLMQDNKIRRIPVVDRSGRLCGMVAQADFARVDDDETIEMVQEVSKPSDSASQVTH
jgi:CBS domain-containing protein